LLEGLDWGSYPGPAYPPASIVSLEVATNRLPYKAEGRFLDVQIQWKFSFNVVYSTFFEKHCLSSINWPRFFPSGQLVVLFPSQIGNTVF